MGNGEKKKKKKHPAEALHRKMALASECCVFSKDLTSVCVCVCSSASKCQVRFSSVCVFFRGASRIETLNYVARSSPFFLPPTFLLQTGATTCGPESESIFHEKSV